MAYRKQFIVTIAVAVLIVCFFGIYAGRKDIIPKKITVFNVMDFGAVGDGQTLDTQAVDKTIEAARMNGGGIVHFPPGFTFLVGSFNISSHIHLVIEGNLQGSSNAKDYPPIQPLPSYGTGRQTYDSFRHAPLIGCYYCYNISVSGNGTIEANGAMWETLKREKKLSCSRPHAIEFAWSENITIHGITIKNTGFWAIHPVYCNHVEVTHITVDNPCSKEVLTNTDNVNPDSSTNVLIAHNRFFGSDDLISIKSGRDEAGRQYGKPSVNITIRDNYFGCGSGISIGSEMSGGVYNVVVENNHFELTDSMAKLKTNSHRGGEVRNIVFRNNRGNFTHSVIYLSAFYLPSSDDSNPPVISDWLFENITAVSPKGQTGKFDCILCTNITMRNVTIIAKNGAHNWQCENMFGIAENVIPPPLPGCFEGKKISTRQHRK